MSTQVGTLRYNGFTFPPAIHASVKALPILDSSGRYTKHVEYTLTVETILYPGVEGVAEMEGVSGDEGLEPLESADGVPPVDGVYTYYGMDAIRLTLLESGKDLVFTGKGLGYDFDIRTSENADVMNGPKVESLLWEPIGANKAVRIVWVCRVAIANCAVSEDLGRVLEFSTESKYSIDEKGLTVRTVTGSFVIPNRLVGDVPQTWVDLYRQKIAVPLVKGFQRIRQEWNVSSDGTTLQFSIVDKQYESQIPLHGGIVEHDVNHRVRSSGPVVATQWTVTVEGTFVVAPGTSKAFAWLAFLWFVKSRRDATKKAVFKDTNGKGDSNLAIPRHLEIDDNLTSRTISFSISWWLFADPSSVLEGSGFLAKVNGSSWEQHATTMRATWRNSGHANMHSQTRRVFRPCFPNSQYYVQDTLNNPYPQDHGRLFLGDLCDERWIRFSPEVYAHTEHYNEALYPTGDADVYLQEPGPDYQNSSSSRSVTIHSRGAARMRVTFSGYAAKLGGDPIKRPKLISYGGVKKLTPIGDGIFHTNPTKKLGECKLHSVRWSQVYEVEGNPKDETEFVCAPNLRIP